MLQAIGSFVPKFLELDPQLYLFPAYYVGVIFGAAAVSKGLGVSIVAAIALLAVYPSPEYGAFVMLFYVPALLYSAFRS